jgi:23S rRNA U2552 (ribose-2'-O)-methylase RlmE/FtsJ
MRSQTTKTAGERSESYSKDDDDFLAHSILANGKVTKIAHQLLRRCVREDDVVVDLTCGRGTDTLLFLELVKEDGLIVSMDVQQSALDITRKRIREEFCAKISDEAERKKIEGRVHFVRDCHSKVFECVVDGIAKKKGEVKAETNEIEIGACTMNLGYLTGKDTDKSIVTRSETTLVALNRACELLRVGGLITICCYRGHEGGQEETDAVLDFVSRLPSEITVTKIDVVNRSGPILLSCYRQR